MIPTISLPPLLSPQLLPFPFPPPFLPSLLICPFPDISQANFQASPAELEASAGRSLVVVNINSQLHSP